MTVSHSPDPYVTCMRTVAQLSIPMVADQCMLALRPNENRQDANVHQQERREHRVRGVVRAAKSLCCKYSVTLQTTDNIFIWMVQLDNQQTIYKQTDGQTDRPCGVKLYL